MRERKGKMSLLKSDFKGQIGYGEYCRLYRKAMGCIESCDIASAKNYMRHMKWSWCGKCLEHRLLKAMLLFAQATKNDYQKILSIFQKMRRELRAFLLKGLEGESHKHAWALYFRILYHIANLHYYMEHDCRSLSAFKECLVVARETKIRKRHLDDVAHKIASLEFMLSANGFRRLEKLVANGRFADACNMVGDAIRNCGIDYIDHVVLVLAATAYFATGNIRRGRNIIDRDFHFSANCLETRFIYAIAHIQDRDDEKRRESYGILVEISGAKAKSSCVIGVRKRRRIEAQARFIVETMLKEHDRFRMKRHAEVMRCLRDVVVFVECPHCKKNVKSENSLVPLTRDFYIRGSCKTFFDGRVERVERVDLDSGKVLDGA